MDKKVSIVLPVYNGEQRVSRSIESVLNQSYVNIELIIVNDCSTDKTLDVINRFAERDSRIKVVDNKTNQKLPRSLNIGFAEASGDYLTWTSDDNAYKKRALSTMATYLDDNDDVDLVYCDFDVVNLDGSYRSTTCLPEPDEMRFQNVVGACFMYRKELAEVIGEYDPEMFLAEDYEYWIRAYLSGKMHHISEVLYEYGWHDKSLTSTRGLQISHKAFEAKFKYFNQLLDRCETQAERNEFFWNMLSLLNDKSEKSDVRTKYYSLDPQFKKADEEKKIKDGISNMLLIRTIRKIKRNMCKVIK